LTEILFTGADLPSSLKKYYFFSEEGKSVFLFLNDFVKNPLPEKKARLMCALLLLHSHDMNDITK